MATCWPLFQVKRRVEKLEELTHVVERYEQHCIVEQGISSEMVPHSNSTAMFFQGGFDSTMQEIQGSEARFNNLMDFD